VRGLHGRHGARLGRRHLRNDVQRGLGFAVAVHQRLQRQHPLARTGGGDDGFSNVHDFLSDAASFRHPRLDWRFIFFPMREGVSRGG
jgi:hypothetical protein